MSGLFRCAGDILFDDHQPLPGQVSNVQLKKYSETSNFLQLKQPLTPDHPYFFAQIRALAQLSTITLGIAGPDIDDDAHPGHWNNTVGYHSNTGRCFSSHGDSANTKGEKFSIGDMFGVLVSYFGEKMSTVMFLKNGVPVATRYLFETDHNKYLPTICLENGPIDLGIMWPQAAMGIPKFDERNMLNWIKDNGVQYHPGNNIFFSDKVLPEVTLQSPTPLTKDLVHYEVVVEESVDGESPAVGIATCSPLWPSPTCVLLRDFFRWKAEGKELVSRVGQRIGFGIHYHPEESLKPDFDDRKQQLVLCFVTMDMQIVFFRMMLQPPGGFYPLIILTRGASKVQLDLDTNRDLGFDSTRKLLDGLYAEKMNDAMSILKEDMVTRELTQSMFRKSDDLHIDVQEPGCYISLPADKKRIHAVQFRHNLTWPDKSYFCAEIIKLNEDSVISIGVGDSTFSLNKHPGKLPNSTGYVSRDGKMFYNEMCHNIDSAGERFGEGDTVGVELVHFSEKGSSVVLFLRNEHPVGTRYVTIKNIEEILPTISLCGNGYEVKLKVFWQNRIAAAPVMRIGCLRHWCIPEDAVVNQEQKIITVKDHLKPIALQCASPLSEGFNHFEICITEEFGNGKKPPPVIALSGACTKKTEREEMSNLRIDYLRFWAVGEAENSVQVGDLVGWGMLIPQSQFDLEERLVICYLTINRNIALTRVLFEPDGGLYPVVVLPSEVNSVQFEFSAVRITSHPITDDLVQILLSEASDIYMREQEFLASGKDIDDFEIDKASLLKPLPKQGAGEAETNTTGEDSKLSNVVMKAKGLNSVQKAVKNYRDRQGSDQQSKACVIL